MDLVVFFAFWKYDENKQLGRNEKSPNSLSKSFGRADPPREAIIANKNYILSEFPMSYYMLLFKKKFQSFFLEKASHHD